MANFILDRSGISMSSLRKDKTFLALLDKLDAHLSKEREEYESGEASEFRRGRVVMLRELLQEMKK